VGYELGGKNSNTVRVVPKGDPLVKAALAVTVLTYDAKSRTILDADVLLNGARRFADVDTEKSSAKDVYDLQAVLTHELGHVHGLDDDPEHVLAAMYVATSPGDTHKRSLSPEDEEALLSLYPDGALDGGTAPGASCASPQGRPRPAGSALMVFAAALAALGVRRRPAVWRARVLLPCLALFAGTLSAGASEARTLHAPLAIATASVAATTAHWDGGLIVTEIELSDVFCSGDCAALAERVVVPGGRVGDLVQVVSHAAVPERGARVVIEVSGEKDVFGRYRVLSRIRAETRNEP
jgi:hypothetical protein